jgi:small subunit ribosomal protein S17
MVKKVKAEECSDKNCPHHGSLKVRGRTFTGTVKSDKMARTVTVEWDRIIKLPKYKRFMKKRSRVKAHNPDCINASNGDEVLISECRPLSKTKKFVVLKVINNEKH